MTDEYVDLTDEEGNTTRWRRYAARIPDFLKEYPPKEGYRVECSTTDLLSLQTGLLSLLKEAIPAGRKPGDLGLPGLERALSTFVCTARLLDPQGRVLRPASACASLVMTKDYEKLETAANQRLLAALGFGGEEFNHDENEDFARQGLTAAPVRAGERQSSPIAASEQRPQEVDAALASLGDASLNSSSGAPGEDDEPDTVPRAMRIQVENIAKRLGKPVPAMKTQQDAEAALRNFGTVQGRRQNGAA